MREGSDFRNQICAHGRGQFDMAHALAADLLQRDFHAAFLADDAAILHALVLAAEALVVLDRPEDARAEQAVTLGLERAVVDRLGLLDLAVGPAEDPLGRGQRDLDLVEGLRRRQRVERVVGEFLVHVESLKKGRGRDGGGPMGRPGRDWRITPPRCRRVFVVLRIQEFHVEAQAADLLDENVERFRHAGLEVVLALDDRLVDLGPARHVVRLHRQHLLQV
jgi:hypothetical protein